MHTTDSAGRGGLTLYIDPPSPHFLGDRLFDSRSTKFVGDNLMAPYVHLRDQLNALGIEIRTADYLPREVDTSKRKHYVSMGIVENYRRLSKRPDVTLSAIFAMECPINEPTLYRELPRASRYFRRIYSWSTPDALVPFTGQRIDTHRFRWPQSYDSAHEELWRRSERKFLVMINANKLPRVDYEELYTERLRALTYFASVNAIDLFGGGWNRASNRVGKSRIPATLKSLYLDAKGLWQRVRPDPLLEAARTVYRGRAASKSSTLSEYTFAICFENMILEGWITEKIFDCFFVGTIPVYWGAPEIAELVPPECFIDMRNFTSYEDLHRYLRGLTSSQITEFRNCARNFLESDDYDPFRKSTFARIFENLITSDNDNPQV
jgi:hypothetical protein